MEYLFFTDKEYKELYRTDNISSNTFYQVYYGGDGRRYFINNYGNKMWFVESNIIGRYGLKTLNLENYED